MKKNLLIALLISAFLPNICNAAQKPAKLPDQMQLAKIMSVMGKVADWQIANPSKHNTKDWTHGALFAGMTAWAQTAGSEKYYNALLEFGKKNEWKTIERKRALKFYYADDHAVAQMYIDMYKKYKDPKMIKPITEAFDWILENQPTTPLTHDNWDHKVRYNWCDALFMAPPVWAKLARVTGDKKYLDYMNKEWWATTDYLFDNEEGLYFRDDRFFEKREANGKKIFWSRGNGWVMGGLVRVLEEMPDDYPDRKRYEDIYKKMAAKVIKIQPASGMWHSSLLDPVTFGTKEASGTGFYCYALAWGINHGYLDAETYLPAVIKSWTGLLECVQDDGKLGNVQPIGADPRKVTADQTEIYGVGAFLLAGTEVYKIAKLNGAKTKNITVENPARTFRESETISIDFKDIENTLEGINKNNITIFDCKINNFLITQVIKEGKSTKLLFQTDFAPGEKKYFRAMKKPANFKHYELRDSATARFVPERMDDFAWENDKTAYRMYGPALEDETITCGIDAFVKSVSYPVMAHWLTTKGYNYHKDQGQGGDFYKVGKTLGCGGAAPYIDGKVCLPSKNYSDWKIIANGPIRTIFELTYKPWQAGSITVSETKRISLDLGSYLNRIECTYSSDNAKTIPVAAGLVFGNARPASSATGNNFIAHCQKALGKNGNICIGIFLCPPGTASHTIKAEGHLLLTKEQKTSEPFVYYAGSRWHNKGEKFTTWRKYLRRYKKNIENPVTVKF